jgi:hypothetical protein
MQGQLSQYLLTLERKRQQDLPPIFAAARPPDVSRGHQSIHKFDPTVVLNLQTLRQFSDGGPTLGGQPFQGEHQLVLSGLQTRATGRLFAE